MPLLPLEPSDLFERAGKILGSAAEAIGFSGSVPPTVSGFGTRQSRIKSERSAANTRKLMRWMVPEQPIVEMYINPQSVQYNHGKQITEQRTKGGYVLQYWGETLTNLTINGTTGTSGIEGINVLYDIYRNEQLMFDPYALFLQAQRDRQEQEELFPSNGNGDTLTNVLGDVGALLLGTDQAQTGLATRSRPSLASLAFSVELYWSGEVYRGFFKDFQVTESATNLGLFDYTINFKVTQKRGFRQNFLGWHRSAVNGPSNSNPIYGTPHSFGSLSGSTIGKGKNNIDQPNLNSPFVDPKQRGLNSIGGQAGVNNRSSSSLLNAYDI